MDGDPLVGRIGRLSVLICLLATAAAYFLAGASMALGVLGGGLLIGISFYTLGAGVAALVSAASGGSPRRATLRGGLVKLLLRYALLGFLAYVMIARLRLHPIGLLIGASSLVASAALEAGRVLTRMRVQ